MKIRTDELLVQQNFATTRSQAKQLINEGIVFHKKQQITKPGQKISTDAKIEVKEHTQYVSRGGKKLEGALKEFHLHLKDKIIADIGASTGGFTDCALQHQAKKVYAIDVGHGQLSEKLLNDDRVINIEKTNIRDLNELPEKADFAVIDLSYISLTLILHNVANLLKPTGEIVALIKPQFEAGPGVVGKDGVIKDEETRDKILQNFKDWCSQNSFTIKKTTTSPITGKQGNKEFLALILPPK